MRSKLSEVQAQLYDYIVKEYKANGKFTDTNRQLSQMFGREPCTMRYNLKMLQNRGLIKCQTVVEPSGYVIRYVTPINI